MDSNPQRAVMSTMAKILDVLDSCPWIASCTCGWRGAEWESEADATAEMWAHSPCYAPRKDGA